MGLAGGGLAGWQTGSGGEAAVQQSQPTGASLTRCGTGLLSCERALAAVEATFAALGRRRVPAGGRVCSCVVKIKGRFAAAQPPARAASPAQLAVHARTVVQNVLPGDTGVK